MVAVAVLLAAAGCAGDDPDAWQRCTGDDARDHVRVLFDRDADLDLTVESLTEDDRLAAVLAVTKDPDEASASLYVLPAPDLPADELADQLEAELSKATAVEVIRCR